MQRKRNSPAILFVLIAAIFTMYQETPAQKKPKTRAKTSEVKTVAPEIAYTVSMPKPHTHLLEVEMRLKWPAMAESTELKMPVWTPGSYLVREYARHVQGFTVTDAAGNAVPWQKINKNTWQVETKGIQEFVAAYKVYSNELTVRTNELNDEHAFWNNSALLMFVKGQLGVPTTVRVVPFGNWKVATGLPAVPGAPDTFRAENYDILYDSPFEVSDYKEVKFEVRGKPHRYVVTGEGNYDLDRLAVDTAKIVEEGAKIFGDLPYDNYTFILNTRGGGGLEHLNSSALQSNRFAFKPESRYKSFLNLVAHEHFHAWNVKRIRPDALGPFDYENENYTRLLWVAEGVTAYYESLLLLRAGLITADDFLNTRSAQIKPLEERPGRFETSLEEASLDAWIKYYRQDENAINNQISYYDKGEVVAMLLDVAIRTASDGARSLDDVMRHLYAEFYKKGKNFTPADFETAAELSAGRPLDDFFGKYVRGRAEIDYNGILNGIGLDLATAEPNKGRAYIGAEMSESDGRLTIRTLAAGTPAYDQGLNTGDQIVAIDGNRASSSFLQSYIAEKKPGDSVKLSIFRFDKLREISFILGSDTRKTYDIVPVASPTEAQERLFTQYLGSQPAG